MAAPAHRHAAAGHRKRARGGSGRPLHAIRLAASAALGGLAYLTLHENIRIRGFEAWLATHVIHVAARVQTGDNAGLHAVWFLEKTERIGLIITPECTVGLLMVPFIAAGALMVWQRVPLRWPLTGLAVALAMLVVVNQLRMVTIVWFVKTMGFSSGFYWGHTMAGSIITIIGLAASLAVFVLLAGRHREFVRR